MDWRNVHYDAIVIGSGAAGGMAAKCLTDGGANVLLLEAGPALAHEACREQNRSADEFKAFKARQPVQSQSLFYNRRNCHLFIDDSTNPYLTDEITQFNWIRSRQAGGRTLIWSRFALRMSDDDFQCAIDDAIGIPWPISYQDLARYYDQVEALIGVRGTMEGVSSLPDGQFLRRHVPSYLHGLREKLVGRCPGVLLLPAREVASDEHQSTGGPPAYSSFGSTILGCDRRKLTFRSNCVVARIQTDRANHARGVVFIDRETNRWYEVSGRVVLLSASTIESTRILLASANRDFPTGLGNSSGVLGHYLMDHFGGPRVVALGRVKGAEPHSLEKAYVPRFCNVERQGEEFVRGYGIQADFEVGDKDSVVLTMGVLGEILPYFENSVDIDDLTLDSCGLAVPKISFRYRENELKMALHARNSIREIVDALGFQPLVVHDETLAPGTRAHELGGARMGTHAGNSVLNRFNQCWDIPNLFVTDGSSFPQAGYKGPTLTIMALTARACDFILKQFMARTL